MQLRRTKTKLGAGVALTLSLLAPGLPAQVRTPVMSLLSKSEIPNPKWPSLDTEAREAAAATTLLKRARPSAWAELAEGSPEAGSGQGGNAWGKLERSGSGAGWSFCSGSVLTADFAFQQERRWGRQSCSLLRHA
jgi:hypothetical protein